MPNGTNIPSGTAPLFLGDYASPMAAVSQKLTEAMIREGERKRDKRSRDRQEMLKSLDFAAVEGLSEKVNQEHLNQVNDFIDETSQMYIDNDYDLSNQQLLNLKKKKIAIRQDIARKKHNVATLAQAQKMYKEGLLDPESGDRIAAFVKEGNAGRDASSLIIPWFDVAEHMKKYYGQIGQDADEYSEEIRWDGKSGTYKTIRTNKAAVEAKVSQLIQNDPRLQAEFNSKHAMTRQRAVASVGAFVNSLYDESVKEKPVTAQMIKEKTAKTLTPIQQGVEDQFKWMDRGLAKKDFGDMQYANDYIHKLFRKDNTAINQLKGTYISGLGGRVTGVGINNDGDILIKSGDKESVIPIPKNFDNPAEVRAAMVTAADMLSSKVSIRGNTEFLEPKWTTEVGEEMENMHYRAIRDGLEKAKPSKEKVVTAIQDLFDDEDIAKTRSYGKVKFDEDTYKINTKEGKEDLLKALRDKMGIAEESTVIEEIPEETTVQYEVDGTLYNIPKEDEDEFILDNPTAKKK